MLSIWHRYAPRPLGVKMRFEFFQICQKLLSSSDPHPYTLFWHSFWHTVWKYVYMAYQFWRSIWHSFRHSIWHLFWHSFWHMYLAYLLTFFLAFYLVYLRRCFVVEVLRGTLRSSACSWGPAEEAGEEAEADIKSNNPHLTGGEQGRFEQKIVTDQKGQTKTVRRMVQVPSCDSSNMACWTFPNLGRWWSMDLPACHAATKTSWLKICLTIGFAGDNYFMLNGFMN